MIKLFTKIKLTQIIIVMAILSLSLTFGIGALGLINMNKINNNLNSMYKDDLLSIARLAAMRSSFLNIRLEATSISNSGYNEESNDLITKHDNIVTTNIDAYMEGTQNVDKIKIVEEFSKYYNEYINLWNKNLDTLKNGGKLPSNDAKKFGDLGDSISKIINDSMSLNQKSAESVNITSNNVYKNSFYLLDS